MKQIINSREAYDKANDLLNAVVLQLNEYTNGTVIDFGEQGFEDMTGNDVCAMDDEYIYMGNEWDAKDFDDTNKYPLHELDLMDAIKILGDLEAGVILKA